MNIGIDARLIDETGVGRYIRNLISELARIDNDNEYVVFLRKPSLHAFTVPNARWHKRLAEVAWHSIAEQFVMPWILWRERLDLVHIPYFNAPIFYPKKYIVTIHDLTILHFDTGKASTLPYWVYKIRRLGYRIILSAGIKRSSHIVAVSQAVKRDIMENFGEKDTRVSVTHEGIDPNFLQPISPVAKFPVDGEFFLYVGNVYPHKNAETLLEAYVLYKNSVKQPASLVFAGPPDYFYHQMEALLPSFGLGDNVIVLHNLPDDTLRRLYDRAVALIFPSKMEGFGLPALEALASGCRVICSDIPVLREILGSHAVFVDPDSPKHFAEAMRLAAQKPHDPKAYRAELLPFLSTYSWKKMAQKTHDLYKKFGGSR